MMGNPCQAHWPSFTSFVIAMLPQLKTLDGTEITKSMQIVASQKLPQMQEELRTLAAAKRAEAASKASKESPVEAIEEIYSASVEPEDAAEDANELTDNTPEARVKIYKELAQQKKEKADREKANQPRQRDYEAEHAEQVAATRAIEEKIEKEEIKQKNEGGWDFAWDEDSKKGSIVLEIMLPKVLTLVACAVDAHGACL